MKRTISFSLALILLLVSLCLPVKIEAATTDSKAGIVATSSAPLNVRTGASSASSVATTLKKGSYVTLLSKSGSWWRVE